MWWVLGAIAVWGAASPIPPSSTADASANRGLYVALRVCSACHKVALPGVGPDSGAPSFAVIHARHDPVSLRRLLGEISTAGHHEMPPIPMSPAEIEDVAAYIATVPPAQGPDAGQPRREGHRRARNSHRIAFSATHPDS